MNKHGALYHLTVMSVLIRSYESFFKDKSKELNVSVAEIPFLIGIYYNEGINQIELVKEFHISEANVSKTCKNLVNKDLIFKEIDSDNNTKKLLFLTDEGKEAVEDLCDLFEVWKHILVESIDREDLDNYSEVLDKLVDKARENITDGLF